MDKSSSEGRFRFWLTDDCDAAPVLDAISRQLRCLRLDDALKEHQQFDVANPPVGDEALAPNHPDATAVLQAFRQSRADEVYVSDATVRRMYRRVLAERRDRAIQLQISEKVSLKTRRRVEAAINRLEPADGDGETWFVWTVLVRRHPKNDAYKYAPQQIVSAWKTVVNMRKRWDAVGSVAVRSHAELVRERALGWLADETRVSRDVLKGVRYRDYDFLDGTLWVPGRKNRRKIQVKIQLSLRTLRAVERWVALRGPKDGPLFSDALRQGDPQQVSLESEEVVSFNRAQSSTSGNSMENMEMLETLCNRQKTMPRSYVRDRLLERGGDWPDEAIEQILPNESDKNAQAKRSPAQEKSCRKKLWPNMKRILDQR